MTKLRVIAKFVGKTSCGFISGRTYIIYTEVKHNLLWVHDSNSNADCPYKCLETFLKNWRIYNETFESIEH